jgi:DNA-binding MurR/RpiR family transcriptional regulator
MQTIFIDNKRHKCYTFNMTNKTTNHKFMTPGQAAEALGVSRWTVIRWIHDGKFKGVTRGGFAANSPHRIPAESVADVAAQLGLPGDGS